MNLSKIIGVALDIARVGLDAATGHETQPKDVARSLINLALQLVPHDELLLYLTEAASARAESLANAAEQAKFGNNEPR